MIDKTAQHSRNLDHAENPSAGDQWIELMKWTCEVLAVSGTHVAIRDKSGPRIVTREQFKASLQCHVMPERLHSDCLPLCVTGETKHATGAM